MSAPAAMRGRRAPPQEGAAPLRLRAIRICGAAGSPTMGIWRKLLSRTAKADPMRFDLADLSLFRHVVEAGSITAGAARANLALAAASTRIRNMEEALRGALLGRRRQGIAPTPAGRTLLQHARLILRQAERLREDLGA